MSTSNRRKNIGEEKEWICRSSNPILNMYVCLFNRFVPEKTYAYAIIAYLDMLLWLFSRWFLDTQKNDHILHLGRSIFHHSFHQRHQEGTLNCKAYQNILVRILKNRKKSDEIQLQILSKDKLRIWLTILYTHFHSCILFSSFCQLKQWLARYKTILHEHC